MPLAVAVAAEAVAVLDFQESARQICGVATAATESRLRLPGRHCTGRAAVGVELGLPMLEMEASAGAVEGFSETLAPPWARQAAVH